MASPGSTNALRHLNCTRLWNFLGVSFSDLGMEGGIVGCINYITPSHLHSQQHSHSYLQQRSIHKSSSIHRIHRVHSSSIHSSNGSSTLNIQISIAFTFTVVAASMKLLTCCYTTYSLFRVSSFVT